MPKRPAAPPGPQWKPAQRRALAGSRLPHPLDPPAPPRTRDEAWARLLEVERAEDALCGPLRMGNAGAEALYAPIREGYASGAAPTTLDPQTERLRATALHTHPLEGDVDAAYQALAAFWVGTAGLGFVFDVLLSPQPWSFMTRGLQRTLLGPPDGSSTRSHRWGPLGHLRVELRRLMFALPEEAFARARDEGLDWLRRHSDGADATALRGERAEVAFVLARDPSLAHELVREALADSHYTHYGSLFGSITDLALARAFVDRYAMVLDLDGALVALDVVEAFGRDAAEMMDKILAARGGRKPTLKPFYKSRLEAARKLALTDPRPPTP
jgi:hypothetical protein